jgi:3-oxoacyl-[acyl-carrier-protein] synthase III
VTRSTFAARDTQRLRCTVKFLSFAHALPSACISNHALIERVRRRNAAHVDKVTTDSVCDALAQQLDRAGAVARFHAAPGERAFDFGVSAGRRALAAAGVDASQIDLLLYVGVGRGLIEPAMANVFQHALRLSNATCFDILDACASWLRGVDVARHMMANGACRRVLILNCEFNFHAYEPAFVPSADVIATMWAGYTVGEAATATVLSSEEGDVHATFKNLGSGASLCRIPLPHANQYQDRDDIAVDAAHALRFHAQSNELAVRATQQLERQFHTDPRLAHQAYDIVFGHAASVPLSRNVLRRLELDEALHVEIFPTHGNTVSAGLPLAMSLALEQGRLKRGQRVLLIVGSAGITTGLASFVF